MSHLLGTSARAHFPPVRPLLLHGVRGGTAVEGGVEHVSSMPSRFASGPGEALGAGARGMVEDRAGGGLGQLVAAAVALTAGQVGRRDRNAAGGDGPGERLGVASLPLRSLARNSVGSPHMQMHPPRNRATSERPGLLPASASGGKAWQSTTRERWQRTRSLLREVTRSSSGRSATCTASALVWTWTTSRPYLGSRRPRLKITPPPSARSGHTISLETAWPRAGAVHESTTRGRSSWAAH